jgi:hypothetical protein
MKNKLKILLLVTIGILVLATCKKNPDLPMPDLQMTVIPKVTKDITKDQNISFLDLPGFSATVVVDLYFKDKPKSMDLMVIMNDDAANTAVVQSDITTFPSSADVTIGNLVDLLPELDSINQIQLGDYFRFYVDLTLEDGTVINGYDTLYSSFDPSVVNLPGSSINVVYSVVCPLDQALTVGSFYALSPPSDWNSKGNITITADPEDPNKLYVAGLAVIDGETEDAPLVMHLDPLTYAVIADKTVIDLDFYGYTNYYFKGSGTFNTCTNVYTMKLEIGSDAGSWGEFNYTFTRN